jgi:hypothetical protein
MSQQMFGAERDPRTLADELYFYKHELLATSGWQAVPTPPQDPDRDHHRHRRHLGRPLL